MYDIIIKNKMICRIISYISGLTFNIYLGLMISDKYTRMFVSRYAINGEYQFRIIFIEAPLNFGIALLIAIGVDLFSRGIQWGLSLKRRKGQDEEKY